MQQTAELNVTRIPFDGLHFDGFICAVSTAILNKGGDLETVWDVTNRVYDRWNGLADWAEARAGDSLALSA